MSSGDWGGLNPGYKFFFRGSVAALDLKTGKLLWSFRAAPEGYTGASVWGTLAIDPQRQELRCRRFGVQRTGHRGRCGVLGRWL